jgi:anti-anti-sigma factor
MLHGNKLDPARKVRVVLCADAERWGAIIEDEGDGFQPSDIPDPNDLETMLSESGRGIQLMDGYLDELLYNRKGNRLLMVRHKQAQPDAGEVQTAVPSEPPPAPEEAAAGPVSVVREGDADVLQVNAKRLNDDNAVALREAILAATSPRVLLDLARVTFISSSGIGVLVHIHKAVAQRGGKLVVTGLQPAVKDTLEAVKILGIFKVYPDRENGLSQLR